MLSKSSIDQNYYKILERDWLSAARFEHELDSVRVMMLVIGQCTRHDACNWTVRIILCALLWCTLLSKLPGFQHS